MLALTFVTGLTVHAQEPLTPLWQHIDPFGAGSILCCSDVFYTRLSYDPDSDRLYRSVLQFNLAPIGYRTQVFDTEGNDLTPTTPIALAELPLADLETTHIVQLSSVNDTLSAIVRYEDYFSTTNDLNWLKVLGTDGSPYYLVGLGPLPLRAFYRDENGTLILTDSELRRYGPTGWPNGSIAVQNGERMAVMGNDVVLGVPPAFSRIDRSTMTSLDPILVPSTGTATSGICIANGATTFNYAALSTNGQMDVGLADISTGPIWSTIISLPSGAQPTAYHVDEQGDFWIAVVQNGVGLLHRFHLTGGPHGVNSFSRRIDGIDSHNGRLFLTGRVTGTTSSTYLAAFDIDVITGVPSERVANLSVSPNPANDLLFLHGSTSSTEGWILDPTGKTVQRMAQGELSSSSIAIGDLAAGSYRLCVRNAKDVVQLPFVIAR